MCTDAVQPISNGAVRPTRAWCRGSRSGGCSARSAAGRPCRRCRHRSRRCPFEASRPPRGRRAPSPGDRRRPRPRADRGAHPADHAFLRREGRVGFLVRDRGDGRRPWLRLRIRGWAAGAGRGAGPGAPSRAARASRSARRRCSGAVAMWVPGTADRRDASPARGGPPLRRLPGADLLVAPRPPVRALRADLAGAGLSRRRECGDGRDRCAGASLRRRGSLDCALGRSRHRDPRTRADDRSPADRPPRPRRAPSLFDRLTGRARAPTGRIRPSSSCTT